VITIPKTLNYVWLGTNHLHPLMLAWQDKWRQLHPGWQVKLWRDSPDLPRHLLICDKQLIECRYPQYLTSCPTFAKRSDVWRYEILEQLGGIYLDTDFEPVRCIEPLLEGVDALAGLCKTKYEWSDACPEGKIKIEVGCSIMGATPHHPWLRELVQLTPRQDPVEQLSLAFPFLTDVTSRHPDVRLCDPDVFYPVTWDRYALGGRRSLRREPLPEGTYAVHRWSSSWLATGLQPRDTTP
jgi:mannosyltransferase OCH1-like enzyme